MDDRTTFDARVYRTEVYRGSEVTTYKVRWKVGGRLWKEGLPHRRPGRQLPERAADRYPEGGGVQSRHRQAGGMGTHEGGDQLV
jgi:hypothetical protein